MAIKTQRIKDIGELRHQCSLYELTPSTGGTGAKTKVRAGTPYAENIWCKWQPFSATKEQIVSNRAGRYETQYFGTLTIPFDEVILDSDMECLYDGIYYKMTNKIKYGESFYFLECICIGAKAI